MQTIEFEAEIIDGMIIVPKKYNNFYNTRAKIIIMELENLNKNQEMALNNNSKPIDLEKSSVQLLDFSKYKITCFQNINAIEYQRETRDAK